MKTSLKKLQQFAVVRQHDKRAQKLRQQSRALDELASATQDMNDMKDCYDRLLSAAAATVNSVYEFSESLKEMGDCLLEKTALNDDEEGGKVLLMLGKKQLELQKLVDGYRSHIVQTITVPSESLLNELRIVEDMKSRCDEKRQLYEDLLKKQTEKGRLKNSKGERFTSRRLQEAQNEFDEEADMFVFRMKSLKQGQSHSLLTQASRHHAAQLSFFRKAVRSLEAVEPHVRLVAEQQHIDYHFIGLKADEDHIYDDYDDETDSYSDDDSENRSEANNVGELSFEYRQSDPVKEASANRNSMELDNPSPTLTPGSKTGGAREPLPSRGRSSFSFFGEHTIISKSAPLFPNKNAQSADQASRKFTSYILPTPDETKTSNPRKSHGEPPQTRQSPPPINPWHSSPLLQRKPQTKGDKLSGPIILDSQSVLRESNSYAKSTPLPLPLSQAALSYKQPSPSSASYAKKAKRHAFSGPITRKPWTTSNFSNDNNPAAFSGSLLPTPTLPQPKNSSPSSSSSPIGSYPKISELHELPLPPPHLAAPPKTTSLSTQSGPLMSKSREPSTWALSSTASMLPTPPTQPLPRSYSIPTGGRLEVSANVLSPPRPPPMDD